MSSVRPCQIGIQFDSLGGIIPRGAYVGIAQRATVVAYPVHMQPLARQYRIGPQQTPSLEHSCGRTAKKCLVYLQCLEYRQQRHAVDVDMQARLVRRTDSAVNRYALVAGREREIAHFGHTVAPRHP